MLTAKPLDSYDINNPCHVEILITVQLDPRHTIERGCHAGCNTREPLQFRMNT